MDHTNQNLRNNLNIHSEIGDNWRFSELHAILGLQQMKRAKSILEERRKIASQYDKLLRGLMVLQNFLCLITLILHITNT